MNLNRELQKMSISDLRGVCRHLGVSCPTSKSDIVNRLLLPLKKSYKMNMEEFKKLSRKKQVKHLEQIYKKYDEDYPWNDKKYLERKRKRERERERGITNKKLKKIRNIINKGNNKLLKKNNKATELYIPEKIMGKKGTSYLVKWKGYSNRWNTWEDEQSDVIKKNPQLIKQYKLIVKTK